MKKLKNHSDILTGQSTFSTIDNFNKFKNTFKF